MRNSIYAGVPSAGRTKYGSMPSSWVYQSRAAVRSSGAMIEVLEPLAVHAELARIGTEPPGRSAGPPRPGAQRCAGDEHRDRHNGDDHEGLAQGGARPP